jgi:4-hydroxy-4-methyl-2-oxoglutarate aldolase
MPTQIFPIPKERLPEVLLARWSAIPTSVAADVLAGLTVLDPAIRPLRPMAGKRLVGLAVTALCEGTDYGPVHQAIGVAGKGDVLMIEAGGRPSPAIIGELLGGSARLKGIAGLVANGAVRDVAVLGSWPNFPVFAKHVTPRGPSSMDRGTVNDVIAMGGVRVRPGDIVIGDDDGVVIVPRDQAATAIEAAEARVRAEEGWEKELAKGVSTLDLFNVPKGVR